MISCHKYNARNPVKHEISYEKNICQRYTELALRALLKDTQKIKWNSCRR